MRPDGTFSKTQRKPVYLTGKRVKTGSKSLTFFLNLEKKYVERDGPKLSISIATFSVI